MYVSVPLTKRLQGGQDCTFTLQTQDYEDYEDPAPIAHVEFKGVFPPLCIQEIQNRDHDSFFFFFFVSVPVGLCCCSTHIIVLFYLHSKDPIKVSGLTQQPLVNLATFSHSPTHDLSIFLLHCTASRNFCAAQRSAVILTFKSSELLVFNAFICYVQVWLLYFAFLGGLCIVLPKKKKKVLLGF